MFKGKKLSHANIVDFHTETIAGDKTLGLTNDTDWTRTSFQLKMCDLGKTRCSVGPYLGIKFVPAPLLLSKYAWSQSTFHPAPTVVGAFGVSFSFSRFFSPFLRLRSGL